MCGVFSFCIFENCSILMVMCVFGGVIVVGKDLVNEIIVIFVKEVVK